MNQSNTNTEVEPERSRELRYRVTDEVAAFVGWSHGRLRLKKWEVMDLAIKCLHDKLSEIYPECPAIDTPDFDFEALKVSEAGE